LRNSRRETFMRHPASFGGVGDGQAHARVGAAPAEVGDGGDVRFGGPGLGGEQRRRRHDLARLAIAALRHVLLDPGLLHGMQALARQALDRDHAAVPDGAHRQRARSDRLSVQVHGAGPAQPGAAPVFGAREPQVVAEHPEERFFGIGLDDLALAVHLQGNGSHGHFTLPRMD
jgi:hypothetical protein